MVKKQEYEGGWCGLKFCFTDKYWTPKTNTDAILVNPCRHCPTSARRNAPTLRLALKYTLTEQARGPSSCVPVLHELWSDGICWNVAQIWGVPGSASTFTDGGSRLAVGVQEVDGIDSFFQPGFKDHCIENVKFEILKIKQAVIVLHIMKSLLGHTKPSTGPHAVRGPRVGHTRVQQCA